MKQFLKTLLTGICMGAVSVIPAISGGTMALITGVFDPLVNAMRRVASRKTWTLLFCGRFRAFATAAPWGFLLALVGGILLGTAATAKIVLRLLDHNPTATYAFFLGLVIASLLPLARRVQHWNTRGVVCLFAGALAGLYVVTRGRVATPDDWWMLLATGAVSACTMILPGISGSFVLMLLGKFDTMWVAFDRLVSGRADLDDALAIAWITLGGIIGLALFSHLLFYLLKHRHDTTLSFLTGLMSVSLWTLWPWQIKVEKFVNEYTGIERVKNIWPWQAETPATPRDYAIVAAVFALGAFCVWLVERFAGKGKNVG